MSKNVFRGAGCNGSTVLSAIIRAIESPSSETVPAGATWPFVTLGFANKSVTFNMLHIQRTVSPSDVRSVVLGRNGYVFFHLKDRAKDFGFATPKVGNVLSQLRSQGFTLDASCSKNLFIARIMLGIFTVIPVLVVASVMALSILRPNGV